MNILSFMSLSTNGNHNGESMRCCKNMKWKSMVAEEKVYKRITLSFLSYSKNAFLHEKKLMTIPGRVEDVE